MSDTQIIQTQEGIDTTTDTPDALSIEELLGLARAASRHDRIELYRDTLARRGAPAVEAMTGWLGDPELMRFALRVIGRAGHFGERGSAIQALEAGRELVPSSVQEEIDHELQRLGGASPRRSRKPAAPSWARRHPYDVETLLPSAGLSWPGFKDHEFGNIAGTAWRRRNDPVSLPPTIVRALRDVHPHFSSWGVERSPEVHFAVADRYRQFDEPESGWRAAKLVVYAHGPTDENPDTPRQVIAGVYIEKGDGGERYGPLDARWDWPRFVSSLVEPAINEPLSDVMAGGGLRIGDLVSQRFGAESQVGGIGAVENGVLVFRSHEGDELFRGWEAMRHHLELLDGSTWHDLHVWRSWPADEAIAAGPSFATDALVPMLTNLARIYLDIVRDALREGIRALHRVELRRTTPDGRGEIVCLIQAHEEPGHFSLPRRVMDELEIPTDGRVQLTVETLEGQRYYAGELSIRSGQEVYYRVGDDETRGLENVAPKEWIRVTAPAPG